jgi:hypothetical protein
MNKKELQLAVTILLLIILAYNGIAKPVNRLRAKTPIDTLLDAYNIAP